MTCQCNGWNGITQHRVHACDINALTYVWVNSQKVILKLKKPTTNDKSDNNGGCLFLYFFVEERETLVDSPYETTQIF